MTYAIPEPDPHSRLEDEGIPDLQDGTPGQQRANDPQEMPVPGDEPVAVEDYGTTGEESGTNEPLDGRLARERPDPAAEGDPAAAAREAVREGGPPSEHRIVADDEGVRPDREKDATATDAGPDAGGTTPEEDAVHIEE